MFEFLGVLMGIALRTRYTLSLDLPSVVWKQVSHMGFFMPAGSDDTLFIIGCLGIIRRLLEKQLI